MMRNKHRNLVTLTVCRIIYIVNGNTTGCLPWRSRCGIQTLLVLSKTYVVEEPPQVECWSSGTPWRLRGLVCLSVCQIWKLHRENSLTLRFLCSTFAIAFVWCRRVSYETACCVVWNVFGATSLVSLLSLDTSIVAASQTVSYSKLCFITSQRLYV